MDVTERLRLLVVGEDATHAARLQALLRDALGDDADIALCHDVSDLHRALQEQSIACVVLALSSQDTANTLDPVLSSVDGEPVVVVADTRTRKPRSGLSRRAPRTTSSTQPPTPTRYHGRSATRSPASKPRLVWPARRSTIRSRACPTAS